MSITLATLSRAYATACANHTIYTHYHTRRRIIAGPIFDRELIAQGLILNAIQTHFPLSHLALHPSHLHSITSKALNQPFCTRTGIGIQIEPAELVNFLSTELPHSS